MTTAEISLAVEGTTIKSSDTGKFVGIALGYKMTFKNHIKSTKNNYFRATIFTR